MHSKSSSVSSIGGLWSGSASRSSARSSDPRNMNPPRPAKDGFEWVWFPEGYWAERALEGRRGSKSQIQIPAAHVQNAVGKMFRWAPKGPKEHPDTPEAQSPETQPQSPNQQALSPGQRALSPGQLVLPPAGVPRLSQKSFSQFLPPKNLPSSPYLSEEAQTRLLQHPKDSSVIRQNHDTWTILNPTSSGISRMVSPGTKPQMYILTNLKRPSRECYTKPMR